MTADAFNQNFAAWLLAKRQAFGMTQQQLADAIGVSKPSISRWENGHGGILASTYLRLKGYAKNRACELRDAAGERKAA